MTQQIVFFALAATLTVSCADSLTLTDGTEIQCESVKIENEEAVYTADGKEVRLPRVKVLKMTDEKTDEEKEAALEQLLKDFKGHKDVKNDNFGQLFRITESNCLRAEAEPAYQYLAPAGWYQNFSKKLGDSLTYYSYMEPGAGLLGHITIGHSTKADAREGTEAEEFKENLEANSGLLKNFKAGKKETLKVGELKLIRQQISGTDIQTGQKRRGYEALISVAPKAGVSFTLLAPDDRDFAKREKVFMDLIASFRSVSSAP